MSDQWDLEEVYDEQISPLMTRIISICDEHEMPMTATFQYTGGDDRQSCVTTQLQYPDPERSCDMIKRLCSEADRLRKERSRGGGYTVAMTVFAGTPNDTETP